MFEEKDENLERLFLDSDFDAVFAELARAFMHFKGAELKGAVWHGSTATT
jgi:hypothetical protein